MKTNEMEKRLIDFSVSTIKILRSFKKDPLIESLKIQLVRSSASSALNYGEARGASSRKDFLHKIRLVLKELRESLVTLKILQGASTNATIFNPLIEECNNLVGVFVKSTKTLEGNNPK
jgi:four helix bundle protein